MKSFKEFIAEQLHGVYWAHGSGNPHDARYVHVKSFKSKLSAEKYASKSHPGGEHHGSYYVKKENKKGEHHGKPY